MARPPRTTGRWPRAGLVSLAALMIAAVAWCVAASVQAATEAEPNGAIGSANEAQFGMGAAGALNASDIDCWKVVVGEPLLLTAVLFDAEGHPAFVLQGENGENLTAASDRDQFSSDRLRLVVPAPTTIYAVVRSSLGNSSYLLTFTNSTNWSRIQGVDESEPNDVAHLATLSNNTATLEGIAAGSYADVDWWRLPSATVGWVRVNDLLGGLQSVTLYAGGAALAGRHQSSDEYVYYELKAVPVEIEVRPHAADTRYLIDVEFQTDPGLFFEGWNETEPNDEVSEATRLTGEGTFIGWADERYDPTDTYILSGDRGHLLSIRASIGANWLGALRVFLLGVDGQWVDVESLSGSKQEFGFLFSTEGSITFQIEVHTTEAHYRLEVERSALPIFDDGVATLKELHEASQLGLLIHPKLHDVGRALYDLATGRGFLFGETMCMRLSVFGEAFPVAVVAGERLRADNASLQDMVVSRTVALAIPSGGEACFRAMSESADDSFVGGPTDRYRPRGALTGDAARVIAEVNASERDGPEGQLALWAATSNLTLEGARAWNASDSTVVAARSILADAGVQTQLLAPAAAVPWSWVILVLIAAAVGGTAAALLAARRARERSISHAGLPGIPPPPPS